MGFLPHTCRKCGVSPVSLRAVTAAPPTYVGEAPKIQWAALEYLRNLFHQNAISLDYRLPFQPVGIAMRSFFAFLLTVFLSVSSLAIAPMFANAQGVMVDKTAPKGTPAVTAPAANPAIKDPENTLLMDLKDDRVIIALRPDLAPKHVARIKELVRQKFYDGLAFHRVIDGFMAQGGDPKGDGTGGSGKNIPAEFSSEHHVRGTASMARASNPDSADSQFFICLDAAPFLDGQYTVWGQVVSGMEFVDHIKKGNKANNGTVIIPDKIVKMQVAADAKD